MDILIFSLIGIVSRLAPHIPNATAVGALALFSGAKLGYKKAFVITLVTMLTSDIFRGFHTTMWATYGALFVTIYLGSVLLKKQNAMKIAGVTLLSSVLFYVVTNFAVWLSPQFMYPKTMSGLFECYVMGLPFFRNSLFGDLLYTGIFFGGYEYIMSLVARKAFLKRT
jgi:hypothetical protein